MRSLPELLSLQNKSLCLQQEELEEDLQEVPSTDAIADPALVSPRISEQDICVIFGLI